MFWLIGVITAFITSFYMFRLLFLTFFGDYRGAQVDDHGRAHASARCTMITAMANRTRARWSCWFR